jgi:sigma-54 specific flagellar transcriptional regulator A
MVRARDLPARYRGNIALPLEVESMVFESESLCATDTLPMLGIDLKEHMARIETNLIRAALERSDGVVAHAAQILCLRRTTLVEKLRKYGLGREGDLNLTADSAPDTARALPLSA